MSSKANKAVKNTEAKADKSDSKAGKSPYLESVNSPVHQILLLQQTIGNLAVQKLFDSGQIQAKLKISQPNDIYEQEADRVAEYVMKIPENPKINDQQSDATKRNRSVQTKPILPLANIPLSKKEEEHTCSKPLSLSITPLIQRLPRDDEEKEEPVQTKLFSPRIIPFVQRQKIEEEEEQLQAKLVQCQKKEEEEEPNKSKQMSESGKIGSSSKVIVASHAIHNKGIGEPLNPTIRSRLEYRMGRDFSNVNVHSDSKPLIEQNTPLVQRQPEEDEELHKRNEKTRTTTETNETKKVNSFSWIQESSFSVKGKSIQKQEDDTQKHSQHEQHTNIRTLFREPSYKNSEELNQLTQNAISTGIAAAREEKQRCDKEAVTEKIAQHKRMFIAILNATRSTFIQMNNIEHPGCHAISIILVHICKQVGIEAKYRLTPTQHGYPYLPEAKIGLKHGDDVYSRGALSSAPAEKLVLTQSKIKEHYKAELQWIEKTRKHLIKFEEKAATPEMIALKEFILEALPDTSFEIKFFKPDPKDPESLRKRMGSIQQIQITAKEVISHYLLLPATLWSYATVRGHPSEAEKSLIVKTLYNLVKIYHTEIPDSRYSPETGPKSKEEALAWLAEKINDQLRDLAIGNIRATSPPDVPSEKELHGL